MAFGGPALLLFGLGIFTKPLETEFGWSRTQLAVLAAIYTYVTMFISPIQGAILDRFGARRVILLTIPAFTAAYALLYFLPPSLGVLYLSWAVITIISAGVANASYNKALAAWFDRRLGLAVGIAVAGQGVGAAIIPALGQALIGHYGFRMAFVGLAATAFVVTAAVTIPFLHGDPSARNAAIDGDESANGAAAILQIGVGLRQAIRRPSFMAMAGAFFCLGFMSTAIVSHQVPMLIDSGVPPERAAMIQASWGIALIFGRVIVGFLLDRFFAPSVLIATLIGVVIGFVMYAVGVSGGANFLAAMLIGCGVGAEFDVLGYLIPRYFGRRAYGKLYGSILSAFQLGGGMGAVGLGVIRTTRGSYSLGLWLIAGITVLAILILTRLGPYPTNVEEAS
jgi:predicted MFS family arabinose efflux permease